MSRSYRFVQVDVFTRRPFGGNQLAVFTDARGLSSGEMQSITREMNYSESTFVLPSDAPGADARVRIFKVDRELPFAGHPTVGTAFVLGLERDRRDLVLVLGAGPVAVRVDPGDGRIGSAEMQQPVPCFRSAPGDAPSLAALIGLDADDLDPNLPAEFGSAGAEFLYLPLRSLDAVRRARGNRAALTRFLADASHPAVYVFSTQTESPDAAVHARMLHLVEGEVQEDAATGSAVGPCAAYLVRHRARRPGRLLVEQGYELGRPSLLEVSLDAQGETITTVRVGGGVVRVAEGMLFL